MWQKVIIYILDLKKWKCEIKNDKGLSTVRGLPKSFYDFALAVSLDWKFRNDSNEWKTDMTCS